MTLFYSFASLFNIRLNRTTWIPLFVHSTFAISWKQPKCPSADEWIKKTWHIYTMECCSVIKKEWNCVICSNMGGLGSHYTQWNKSDRERQTQYVIIYTWNQQTSEYITRKKQIYQYRTNKWLPVGRGKGEEVKCRGLRDTRHYVQK